jgi:undecaprenyl-diphosphatase
VWLLIAALAALLWRRPSIFAWVLAGDVIADLTSYGLRAAIGRDRPPARFAEPRPLVHVPHDPSFPSGHAATSFACAALLAWLTPLPKALLFALAALIAFSRVYNGVHYPLDVLGGAALGLAVATALRLLAGGRRRSALEQR